MIGRIKQISSDAEIAIVVVFGFGIWVYASLQAFIVSDAAAQPPITNQDLIGIVIVEIILLAVLLPFLRLRGWTASAIGMQPTIKDTLLGIPLAFAALATNVILLGLFGSSEHAAKTPVVASDIAPATVALLSIINPIFEELLVCGYLISALMERRGIATAIVVSAVLRGSYHLYQGALAAAIIGIIGFGFAIYYVRTGRLWPIIAAHMILDGLALSWGE